MNFQDMVDTIANKLRTWRATLLDRVGHHLLVQTVLCAMPIHAMMALDIPPKVLASIVKIYRGFLWVHKADARGGQCAVAWDTVCTPKWCGGLGLPNLRWLNMALRARWAWLKRVDDARA